MIGHDGILPAGAAAREGARAARLLVTPPAASTRATRQSSWPLAQARCRWEPLSPRSPTRNSLTLDDGPIVRPVGSRRCRYLQHMHCRVAGALVCAVCSVTWAKLSNRLGTPIRSAPANTVCDPAAAMAMATADGGKVGGALGRDVDGAARTGLMAGVDGSDETGDGDHGQRGPYRGQLACIQTGLQIVGGGRGRVRPACEDVIELIGDVADRLLGVDGDVPQFGDAAVGLAP